MYRSDRSWEAATMGHRKWNVHLAVDETGDLTEVRAVLVADGVEIAHGDGRARRHPADRPVARIGDELAVSRALYALADRLMDAASRDLDLAAGRG
jgi:hypothetical protein